MIIEEKDRAITTGFVGGRLCLDFANTVTQESGKSVDNLDTYSDLVTWAFNAKVLTNQEAKAFHKEASLRPAEAIEALKTAKRIRTVIYNIFTAVSDDQIPGESDLATLNKALRDVLNHIELVKKPTGFEWDWRENGGELDQLLWPVVKSAGDTLTAEGTNLTKQCEADDCEWLFIDRSKNHSRRWCDMSDCGNRAKARRYYARKRVSAKS